MKWRRAALRFITARMALTSSHHGREEAEMARTSFLEATFNDIALMFIRGENANGKAIVRTDGTMERGQWVDIQDKSNDPDGIGYVSVLVSPDLIRDVYANEIAGVEV